MSNDNFPMKNYQSVPGKGLNTQEAKRNRLAYLREAGVVLEQLQETTLSDAQLQHKVEAVIGSVEIPVGLAGPLLFRPAGGAPTLVYAPVATLEGALIASMNRGAKAISLSSGFSAEVHYQRMVRCPMLIFSTGSQAGIFSDWVESQFTALKKVAEQYSNHAQLLEVDSDQIECSVHLRFVYTTGDASGQNMTTTCTWHALKWLVAAFEENQGIRPLQYVVEGNSSSEKKLSRYAQEHGRGISVTATCELDRATLKRVFRVEQEALLECMHYSKIRAKKDGMWGYNINVANAIAGIFAATGQDLGSLHESCTGFFDLEPTPTGLSATLHLSNLVVGTVGGGTMLPRQQEALQLMGCTGQGSANRLAKLIAGFALGLELSTLSAIVGGQFAKVHEKMGRNKPVQWLLRSELDVPLIKEHLLRAQADRLIAVRPLEAPVSAAGIITTLTARINRKLTGLFPLQLSFGSPADERSVLLKVKPTDKEVLQGLQLMAGSIDTRLADLLEMHGPHLEYHRCHLKEGQVYQALSRMDNPPVPNFYGHSHEPGRGLDTLLLEWLPSEEMQLFNAENEPDNWTKASICTLLRAIEQVHRFCRENVVASECPDVQSLRPWLAADLYRQFADIIYPESGAAFWGSVAQSDEMYWQGLKEKRNALTTPQTLVHYDFNPRNAALRNDGRACIYDWELSVWHIPQRDVVEFLSFTLPAGFCEVRYFELLKYYHEISNPSVSWQRWQEEAHYAVEEFLLTRVSFYLTGQLAVDYRFADRVAANALRMLELLPACRASNLVHD